MNATLHLPDNTLQADHSVEQQQYQPRPQNAAFNAKKARRQGGQAKLN